MRSLEESSTRWQRTVERASNLRDLKLSVRSQSDGSPCVSGLRSVCWKIFLLFHTIDTSSWSDVLADSRSAYTSLREHFLKYVEHPEVLGSALDPLNDDKNSPWNILRQDEELRAEIMQDVQRCMPEEQYFRQAQTQRMLLDILFIFCKMNQDVGYRQGMHELLAPILWVVENDSLNIADTKSSETAVGELIMETLSASFIEHDAFTIFSLLMHGAKSFYELGDPERRSSTSSGLGNNQNGASPIVERSKRIHEVYLACLDPELADHLTVIEVLPQIFLIRWIRILFGREFPFDSLLSLWDILFAEDPALDLVDMICVAMLLRIRWQLIEADYSVALTLLLKYPFPKPPHGPQTFVEDALYLRENFNPAGATKIISTYSGRAPLRYAATSRPATPSGGGSIPERKVSWRRPPLPSPARFLQQQGGVEALIQGAAKGVFERGEKLGINKAVRDAVGEVKKNMQGLQAPSPSSTRRRSDTSRLSLDEGRAIPSARKIVASMEQRNKQLGKMLDEALSDLRRSSALESGTSSKSSDALGIAIAKLQFVQVCLENSSMPLPPERVEDSIERSLQESPSAQKLLRMGQSFLQVSEGQGSPTQATPSPQPSPHTYAIIPSDKSNVSPSPPVDFSKPPTLPSKIGEEGLTLLVQPRAPIPTRSTLAQSSFAFMLEPDESSISALKSSSPKASSPFLASGKRRLSGPSREKAAFLFGDEAEGANKNPRTPSMQNVVEGEFNLGTMKCLKDQ